MNPIQTPPTLYFKFFPRDLRAKVCNGCGGKGGWFKPIHWWNISEDCDAHDFAYFCGGTNKDRKIADKLLRKAILSRCANAPLYKRWYYKIQAWLYYEAVRAFGAKYFTKRAQPLSLYSAIDAAS
jgi:hypothetical protein